MSKVFQSPSKIKVGSNQDKNIVIMKASLGCSAVTWMWPDISSTTVCLSTQLTADFILISFLLFISILSELFLSNLNPATNERKKTHLHFRLLTSDIFHYICTSKPSRHTAGPEHNSTLVAVPSATALFWGNYFLLWLGELQELVTCQPCLFVLRTEKGLWPVWCTSPWVHKLLACLGCIE